MQSEVRRFQEALMANGAVDKSLVSASGFSLGPEESRRGSSIASCYTIGAHTVLFCDPDLTTQLQGFADAHPEADRGRWLTWAREQGAVHLGSGVMRVRSTAAPQVRPPFAGVSALSAADTADVARIHAFLDGCDEDEIEDADIDRDNLDPVIRCTLDGIGAVSAFASALPWDALPDWWDIGVLTAGGHRRQGLGKRCVAAVVAGIEEHGGTALYRHDPANTGSAGVASSLGFDVATELDAVRFGAD